MAKPQGFATMTADRRRAIAAMGGRAAQAAGVAHNWTHEEAKVAGRIGGLASGKAKQAKRVQPEVQP